MRDFERSARLGLRDVELVQSVTLEAR